MPRPIPLPVRQRIFTLAQQGLDGVTIARRLHLSVRTVQYLVQRFEHGGFEACPPRYRAGTRRQPSFEHLLQQGLFLHEAHPTWGAGFIRVRLQLLHPQLSVPSERTLQRYFRGGQPTPPPPGRKPASDRQPARHPHDVWQMDAVEQLRLASGQRVSWLRWVDEFSGAVLGTVVFPQGYWNQVPVADVQAQLRRQFRRWGLPHALRVDNGNPWGNWSDLPTVLTLWLLGLGVQVLWNDPGRPQQNSKVERSQGTGKRWAEPRQCRDVPDLQARLEEADYIQRECYPAVGQLSRLAAFPQLHHSGQPYRRRWEADTWSLERVTQHLAEYVVRRVVSSGRVTLYDQRYYVGRAYDKQTLFVHFDPDGGRWVIKEEQGREVRSHPARGITQAQIVKLRMQETN